MNKKSLPRSIRLEHNLDEQIDWLKNNKENANNNAFNYAHITSKDTTRFAQIPLLILGFTLLPVLILQVAFSSLFS